MLSDAFLSPCTSYCVYQLKRRTHSALKHVGFSCLFFFPSAVGEPPLCMSCASLFAVKHAVEAARDEIEKGDDYFAMSKS